MAAGGRCPIPGAGFQSRPGFHSMPKMFSDPEAIAEDIIRDVGTSLWRSGLDCFASLAMTRNHQYRLLHLFLFTGLRLAMNAAMPSDRSSSAKVE